MHRHIRLAVYDHGTNGDAEITAYVDAASTVSDPYVRSRIVPQGEHAASEVITEFAPAPQRPIGYPGSLPFVPDRLVWTTESPDGRTPEGARWPCTDPDVLLETVVSVSVAEGWRVIETPRADHTLGTPAIVLRREHLLRELQIVPMGKQSMLQMWDVPETLFHSPTA